MVPLSPASLKTRALRLLSRREHSRGELARKLSAHGALPDELDLVLDELQGRGFISEERVVESVIRQRSPKVGAAKIRQELKARGVSAEALAQALAHLQVTELERAREVWQKKFAQSPAPTELAQRAKQARFLASRGFSPDVIARVVSGSAGDDE